jgi:hypothetical protein
MRGALQIHSPLAVAVLIAWSLVSAARERIAPLAARTVSSRVNAPEPAKDAAPPAIDRRVWN